ncbi:MAG: pitrilysin family protein [Pseudomonadota bacterium]
MKNSILLGLFVIGQLMFANPSYAEDDELAIPYSKYVLDNGLTLVVHEDKKAPIVAINVWYHVGSKDEKEGRTGFAHLFEHLMFNGSENYNDDWFKPFDRVGATGMNGTTNQDRTNYFEVVPKNALEMALWMESDRMGHLLGAIDQAKLDEQREVVKNEKRQGENQPYGKVFGTILENVYPEGHPYSWSVIGSMEDLNAASVEDVHEWFKTKYGAANATIVIAGDVEPEPTLALVKKYFGHIDAGPPQTKQSSWVAKRIGKHTQTMYDRVPQARVYKIWNVAEWGSEDADYLELASAVLSSDKKSRLYNRLVYNERVASDISAFSFTSEIGGLFGVIATALDESKLPYIEQAIDEELAKFLKSGPTKEELFRIKNGAKAGFIRGMERIGGFGGKSDLLARNEVFGDDPNFYLHSIERFENASAKKITEVANKWLNDGEYVLRVLPFPTFSTSESTVDRSTGIPGVGEAPVVSFDTLERATLSNGLNVVLAKRDAIPIVKMRMLVDSGFAADQFSKPGTANLTMQMLDEGAGKMDALEISTELAQMGTQIGSGAGLDSSQVRMDTLKENLAASMEIYADIILRPTFPADQLERLKAQQLAQISQEKSSPFGIGSRLLPGLLFGEGHAYSGPFSGSGNEDSVAAMTVADLEQYHQTWFKADNATLIVAGDITMEELKPLAEEAFSEMPQGEVPTKNIANIDPFEETTIYLVDRPDAAQSAIIGAKMLPEYGFDGELPLQLMNEVLGGSFNSRINMNLREDKGWSYGARSSVQNTQSQRPFIVQAPVQSDKTAESIQEIYKELSGIRSDNPATDNELGRSLDKRTLTLPGRWETAGSVESDIAQMIRYGLKDGYWDKYVKDLREVTLDQVNDSAKTYITPDNMIWLIVGDRRVIEQKIRDLGLGNVVVLDAEGNPVEEAALETQDETKSES